MRGSLGWFSLRHDGTVPQGKRRRAALWGKLAAWLILSAALLAAWHLITFIHSDVGWKEVGYVLWLGLLAPCST